MKAYVIEKAGGPEVLQLRDIAAVEPGADEVQIRVRAFGLNRAEVYRRAGKMGPISGQVVPCLRVSVDFVMIHLEVIRLRPRIHVFDPGDFPQSPHHLRAW